MGDARRFSKYAHRDHHRRRKLREKREICPTTGKVAYRSRQEARDHARVLDRWQGRNSVAYTCRSCGKLHVGRALTQREIKIKKAKRAYLARLQEESETEDVLLTKIG